MSFQAYLDNIKAKTGKTADDFVAMAAEKNLTKTADILAWLKTDFGLGHGHAMAIVHLIVHREHMVMRRRMTKRKNCLAATKHNGGLSRLTTCSRK